MKPEDLQELGRVSAARSRIATTLTAAMMTVYFGFILLIAFDKPLMGQLLGEGLSLGLLLGMVVIVIAWLLTGAYVRWANEHYDGALARLTRKEKAR